MSKARGLADLGNVYSDGALSNRNMIINGGFEVWQRSTDTTGTYFAYKTADRWRHYNGAMSMRSYRVNVSSDTDVPTQYALGLEVTSAQWGLKQIVEYVKAGTYTLSFYIKASVAGTLNLYDPSESVAITTDWQRVEKVITVSSGQNDIFIVKNTAQSLVGTVYITGVQLEVGDTATPFEHRSYGEELALCQRYTQATGVIATNNPSTRWASWLLPVVMRAAPTVTNLSVDSPSITTLPVYDTAPARFHQNNSVVGGTGTATFILDAEL